MALKVYSGVKNIPMPEPDYSWEPDEEKRKAKREAEDAAEEQYIEDIKLAAMRVQIAREQAGKSKASKLVGKTISFGVADGYAQYIVWNEKPLELIHIGLGDGYSFPYVERLTLSDIKGLVKMDEDLAKLFEKSGNLGVDKS